MKLLPWTGRTGAAAVRLRSAPERPLDPIHAWNVLATVNDSVRNAETKGALILGTAGAVGGILYNLYGTMPRHGIIVDLAATVCGISTVAAAVFAAFCVMPRLRLKDSPSSIVYFHHITRRHQETRGGADYSIMLKAISVRPELLIDDLAVQIWANAQVARKKYYMASLGIIAILMAFAALAATVVATVIT